MSSKGWGVTHFSDVVEFCYEWKVVNPSRCLKIYEKIESPPLNIPGTGGLVCHLVCTGYFSGDIVSNIQVNQTEKVMEEASLFSISLDCVDSTGDKVKLAGFVEVLCDGMWLRGKFGDQTKDEFIDGDDIRDDRYGWVFDPEKPIKYYLSTANKFKDYSGFWHSAKENESLNIKLCLFSPGEMTRNSCMMPSFLMNNNSSELVTNMRSLIQPDPKHADVVIECKGEKFHCHKAILGARSAVFYRMFDVNMKEATNGVVSMDDVEADITQAMVEYIYTGEVTKQVNELSQLVYIGDKYELKGLVDLCFRKFSCDQVEDNLVEMLILADKHSLAQFKDLAMNRIIIDKNKFITNQDFKRKIENHPRLLFELFQA